MTLAALLIVSAGPLPVLAAPTFTAVETISNITTGTSTSQAVVSATTTANVAQVKATRTLTVTAVPANAVTLTIGLCAVTFNTGATQDVNCADNAAAINTTTDASTSTVASRLRSLATVSDTGHGALTVTGTTTTAVFTTTNTESTSTPITASLSSGSDITLTTVNTSGVVPVAQVMSYTPSNVEIGDSFAAIINGTTVSFAATSALVSNVTAGLTTAINASAQASLVTAVNQTTRVDVTSDVPGTAFTFATSTTNRAAVAQTVTFTPAAIENGDFNITINGTVYTLRPSASATVQEVVEAFAPIVDGDAAVSCTEDDAKVTCVAASAGTAFTYSSDVTNVTVAENSGSHHSSGGGSRSSASTVSSGSTLLDQLATLKAQVAALIAARGNTTATVVVSGTFARDLDVGVTGEDARLLQKYLNSHGFTVSMSGAGSAGSETDMFGAATKAALAKFQASVGISPAAGFFGPKTRAYVESHP